MEPGAPPPLLNNAYMMQAAQGIHMVNQYGQVFVPIQAPSSPPVNLHHPNLCIPSSSPYVPMISTQNRYTPLYDQEFPSLPCDLDVNLENCISPYEAEGIVSSSKKTAVKRRASEPVSAQPQFEKANQMNQRMDSVTYSHADASKKMPQKEKFIVNQEFEVPEEDLYRFGMVAELNEVDTSKKLPEDFSLGKCLKEILKGDRFEFETFNERKKMIIFVKTEEACEKMKSIKVIGGLNVNIQKRSNTVRGIIKGIPLELSEQEVIESIDSQISVISAKRQKRFNRESRKLEDSLAILLTFESNFLPPAVWMCGRKRIVQEYNRPIIQCHRCQRYGHIKKNCRAKEDLCLRCAGKHQSAVCPLKNLEQQKKADYFRCVNCKRNHPSTSSLCSVRRRNLEVLKVAEKHQMSYGRAETVYRSYAEVVNKNVYKEHSVRTHNVPQLEVKQAINNTANKIVIGLLLSPELLDMANLPLKEKVEKLCKFIENLGIAELDCSSVIQQCKNK